MSHLFSWKGLVLLVAVGVAGALAYVTLAREAQQPPPSRPAVFLPYVRGERSAQTTPVPTTPTVTPPAGPTVTPTATLTSTIPILPPGGPRAASNLRSEVGCEPGLAFARLSWTPARAGGRAQRVDVTIYAFDIQYDSSQLLSPEQSFLLWTELRGQALHDWRVLTLYDDGWVPSETAVFEGPTCVGRLATATPAPPPPIP